MDQCLCGHRLFYHIPLHELWKPMLSFWELQAVLRTCISKALFSWELQAVLRIKIWIKTFKNYGYVYDLYSDVCRIIAVLEFMS
ncbi:hypothetical protein I3843_11G069700 [Carya illinoinensis]|nr:hypothetical protein I3843_11G069700 [Carya illinoinensis]